MKIRLARKTGNPFGEWVEGRLGILMTMQKFPTVLLQHRRREGDHYDWLLRDPRSAPGDERGMWAARVRVGSAVWPRLVRWDLELLPHHRLDYLTYEGPISRGRGWVRRVDEGWFVPMMWLDSKKVIRLQMGRCAGIVMIISLGPGVARAWWICREDWAGDM